MNKMNTAIIAFTILIVGLIILGIYAINKASTVASDAAKVLGDTALLTDMKETVQDIGKMVKEINDTKVISNIDNTVDDLDKSKVIDKTDQSINKINSILDDVNNTQLVNTIEGAAQDARTLMGGVDDASMQQFNRIIQNCGDGITLDIPKGKLAQFTVDVPGFIGSDVNVEVPSSDMNVKLNFPGCSENFSKEAFSSIIQDTFKRKDLPRRFEKEFHIDANGHIRTGV